MIYHFIAEQTEAGLDFDITLDKDKSVYCFIGENAVGKTNLLENMARSLLYCHSLFNSHNQVKYAGVYQHELVYDAIKSLFLRLAWDVSLNETKIKDKNKDKWVVESFNNLINSSVNMTIDKPIVFVGAKNRGYTQNINRNHIKILGNNCDRFLEAFISSFNYMNGKAIEETEIADWFSSRLIINPNFVTQNQNCVFEAITVLELMQKLEPSFKLITENNGKKELDIKFSDGKLYINSIPIDKLATGIVSLIKIFQEIIADYGGWTGFDEKTDLNNVEGIVFIDEIESHLHPKWQSRIISLLKEFFPNTTFYIATHSPVIVSTTDEGEAYELVREGNKVTAHKLGNPKQWYLTSVFTQAFHVDFMDSKVRNTPSLISMLKDYSTLVKDYVSGKDEHLKLEAESGNG
jgi:AAA15 family ATPase/GTPase